MRSRKHPQSTPPNPDPPANCREDFGALAAGPPARPLCVRVPAAARMLGIGLTKTYELIGAGEIEIVKLGRVTLIPVASLEGLIARHSSKG